MSLSIYTACKHTQQASTAGREGKLSPSRTSVFLSENSENAVQ